MKSSKLWVAGTGSSFGISESFQPRFADRARAAIQRPALKCRSHKESFRSSRPEKKCARALIGKLPHLLNDVAGCRRRRTWPLLHILRASHREGDHVEHEERRGETSGPQ